MFTEAPLTYGVAMENGLRTDLQADMKCNDAKSKKVKIILGHKSQNGLVRLFFCHLSLGAMTVGLKQNAASHFQALFGAEAVVPKQDTSEGEGLGQEVRMPRCQPSTTCWMR